MCGLNLGTSARGRARDHASTSHKIEFIFLNGNLVPLASRHLIFSHETFPFMEERMFGGSAQDRAAESTPLISRRRLLGGMGGTFAAAVMLSAKARARGFAVRLSAISGF